MIRKLTNQLRHGREKLAQNRAKRKRKNKLRRLYRGRIQEIADERQQLERVNNRLERELAAAKGAAKPIPKQIAKLEMALADNNTEIWRNSAKMNLAKGKRDDAVAAFKRSTSRVKWWVKKNTTLRRKLKKAKAQENPPWESWMANGHDAFAEPEVLAFLARGVVHFGLSVTSIHRNFVPPGGSTTSYHLQDPSKAGDIAGARMAEFQQSEYRRNAGKPNCLELMGPDNSRWLKFGNQMFIAEGDPLETLHDSHVHGAFE